MTGFELTGAVKATFTLANTEPGGVVTETVFGSATVDLSVKLPCPDESVVIVVADKILPLPVTFINEPLISCPVCVAVP